MGQERKEARARNEGATGGSSGLLLHCCAFRGVTGRCQERQDFDLRCCLHFRRVWYCTCKEVDAVELSGFKTLDTSRWARSTASHARVCCWSSVILIGKGAGCTGRMLRHQEGGLAHSQRLASKALVHPRLGVKAAEELLALTRDFVARLVLLRAQPVVPHRVLELLHVLRVVVGEAVHFSPLEPRRRSKGLLLRRLGDVEVVLVPELVARPAPIGAGPLFAGGLQEGGGGRPGRSWGVKS